jgi:hypothetical protein
LLLAPSFTELEWGIRPELDEWAETISFDMPGIGDSPLPDGVEADPARAAELLGRWREVGAERAVDELARLGWERFFIVTDGRGAATAIEVAGQRHGTVQGLAFGHAALSRSTEGDRPPERPGIWDALAQLARQGNEAFVRYGIAQATRGGIDEETAEQMIGRFPNMDLVSAMVEALAQSAEPIGAELAALDLPLLLGKHEGCLGSTDEGFEDIVASFPKAQTVICPEACSSSPAFAVAIREFCERLA